MRSSLSHALSICPFLFSLCPFAHLSFLLSVHLLSLSLCRSLLPLFISLFSLSVTLSVLLSCTRSFTIIFTLRAEAFIQRALQWFIHSQPRRRKGSSSSGAVKVRFLAQGTLDNLPVTSQPALLPELNQP